MPAQKFEQELRDLLARDPGDLDTATALAGLLEAEARHEELVEVLLSMAEQVEEPAEQGDLLARIGRILNVELGQSEHAAAALEQALELDPDCVPALEQVAHLHRLESRWSELFEVLERLATLAPDAPSRAELHLEMARLYEDRLYEKEQATASYRKALDLDDSNVTTLKALERLHREQEQWEPLAEVLARMAELEEEAELAVPLLERAAELNEEKLGRAELATEQLEDALALVPDHAPAQRALQRLYRRAGRFLELADLLTLQLENTWSPSERMELQLERAVLFEEDLDDAERAVDALRSLQELDPDSEVALEGQARLHGKMEQWDQALKALGQLADHVDDPARLAETYFRMGEIRERVHQDLERAEHFYQEALAHAPEHLASMAHLIELTSARGDWGKTARMLERAAEAEPDPGKQADRLLRGGEVYLGQLEDEARGVDLLERSLALAPAQPRVAELLRPIYARAENHQGLEPLQDLLLSRAADLPEEELLALHMDQARTCEALGRNSKALRHYRVVLERNGAHLEAMTRLADLLCSLDESAQAYALLRTVLQKHAGSLSEEHQAQLHHRLGTIQLQLDEPDMARASFRAALELDPTNRAALEAMGTASAEGENWAELVAAKRELLVGAGQDERLRLLAECGEICLEQLEDPEQAAADFLDALELDPENWRLLHGLLEAYQQTEQWPETVEVLDRQIALEEEPARRARYLYAQAMILRDELDEAAGAIAALNQALDDDPLLPRAFESIDALYQDQGKPRERVKNHRRMIKRLSGKDGEQELQVKLWHELGHILHEMGRLEDAALALDVACKLDPKDRDRLELLAKLYGKLGAGHAKKAVKVYRALLALEPNRTHPYRGLCKAYRESGKLDPAYCVAAMLAFTGKAKPVEQQLFLNHSDQRLRRARGAMDEKLWQRRLVHPFQDTYISAMLALVTPVVGAASARPAATFKLRAEQRHDLSLDPDPFCGLVAHMTQVLGVAVPELYMNPSSPAGLELLHTSDVPTLRAGGGVLKKGGEVEQAYQVAARLALLRPELYLRGILESPAQLKTVVYMAFRLVKPDIPIPTGEEPAVAQSLAMMADKFHPAQLKQLRKVVGKFAASGRDLNLNRWWRGAGLTINRAGFVLCNDLKVAVKAMLAEPSGPKDASPEEKVEELVRYAASEDYFALRRHLGLALEEQGIS